ncbi:MAG: PHP domain-containing protein [Hominisplanchenecus sp.]
MIDLHVHSTCSDGTFTPGQLVNLAAQQGLSAFALTDHDTVLGIDEAVTAARASKIEVVPGIEFSTEYNGCDIHVVGLDLDWHDSQFQKSLKQFQDSRTERNLKMIQKLADLGIDISPRQMKAAFGDAVMTRAHFARYLLEKGYVVDRKEAFSRYIGDQAPCFVPREKVTPAMAVRLICETKGIAVLAHPMQYPFSEPELILLLKNLRAEGLAGIEAIYSTHSHRQEAFLRTTAKRLGLAISGGSDFHGANKPDIHLGTGKGNLRIPDSVLTNLRKKNIWRKK